MTWQTCLIQEQILESLTVESQWLEHIWDHGNLFVLWVVQATID